MSQELSELTITELAPLIEKQEVSPVELTKAVLDKIEANDSKVNAYITVMKEEALNLAQQAEEEITRGAYKGPLHGIPLAVKDNIDIEGVRSTHGSKIHEENIAESNATVITRLLEAGMIPIGKTNMHEYAYGITNVNPHYGPTRNPWNLDKIVGGSSGGSGAALAADMTIAALGTDTAGSVRIPSAICGTVGLKPTFGRVSKNGVFPLSWTLDHVGPMTKSVEDASLMLEAMAGFDSNDPSSIDMPFTDSPLRNSLEGVVIGIPEKEVYANLDPSVEQAFEETKKELERLGAEIRPVTIQSLKHVAFVALVTFTVEAASIHNENIINRLNDFGEDVRTFLKFGKTISGVEYTKAQQLRRVIANELNQVFESTDALLLPTVPIATPDINQTVVDVNGEEVDVTESFISLNQIANVSGLPSLSIPSGLSNDNLPVGIQLVGKAFDERTILNIGHQLEQHQPLLEKKISY